LGLLDRCLKTGTSVIAGGPYNSGLLAGGTRRTGALRYDYGEAPQHILDRVRRIETFCDRHGVPIAAAALQFPLGHPAVASVRIELHDERLPPASAGHRDWHNDYAELLLEIGDAVEAAAGRKAKGVIIRRIRDALRNGSQDQVG